MRHLVIGDGDTDRMDTSESLDIPCVLRAVRRRSGLNQRELAASAGLPQQTLAKIESAAVPNPSVRTVQRLVQAGDCELAVIAADGTVVVPLPRDEEAVDRAGRHMPAHLRVRPVLRQWHWWAYAHQYSTWARPPIPLYTFDWIRTTHPNPPPDPIRREFGL
ncbi:hypothetical protein BH24ACT13_BH24ACT13_07920 [soil metagenome]